MDGARNWDDGGNRKGISGRRCNHFRSLSTPPKPSGNPRYFWHDLDESNLPGKACALFSAGGLGTGIFILNAVRTLEDDWGQLKPHSLFSPGHFTIYPGAITGGPVGIPVPFQFAGYCKIEYVIWHSPDDDPADVKHEVAEYVTQIANLDPWLREHPPEIEWNFNWPATSIDPNHPIVQTMLAAHELVAPGAGQVCPHHRLQGFCAVDDATWLNNAGIPSITYGPGSLHQAHSENEYVPVEEVITATKAYALAALNWCGTGPRKSQKQKEGYEDH